MINSQSGSFSRDHVESVRSRFAGASCEITKTIDVAEGGVPNGETLNDAGVSILVVLGGDGSINSAVTSAAGWDGAILPLPGGTSNLLCKRLYGDRSPEQVASLFVEDQLGPQSLPCISGREFIALCEVLAGPGALWADIRESMRDGEAGSVIALTASAIEEVAAGPSVRLAMPDHAESDGYAGIRLVPHDDGIEIEGYGARDLGEIFQQGAAILKRNFREGPHDKLGKTQAAKVCIDDGGPMPLMFDGERCNGGQEERFILARTATNLLVPQA